MGLWTWLFGRRCGLNKLGRGQRKLGALLAKNKLGRGQRKIGRLTNVIPSAPAGDTLLTLMATQRGHAQGHNSDAPKFPLPPSQLVLWFGDAQVFR